MLPRLRYGENKLKRQVAAFGGLDIRDGARDGTFVQAQNVSSREFPSVVPRSPRSVCGSFSAASSVFGWDKLVVVDGTDLYYDGQKCGVVSAGEKQFAVVNTKLIIWPDKKYLDLQSKQFGDLGASAARVEGTTVSFAANSLTMESTFASVQSRHEHNAQAGFSADGQAIMRYDDVSWTQAGGWVLSGGEEVAVDNFGSYRPQDLIGTLAVGDKVMLRDTGIFGSYPMNTRGYFIEYPSRITSWGEYGQNNRNGYYGVVTAKESTTNSGGEGVFFHTQYVTIRVQNAQYDGRDLGQMFFAGDKVRISGCTSLPDNNTKDDVYLTVQSATRTAVTFKESTLTAGTEAGAVTLTRPVPDLDFICEKDNRLWGVSNKQVGKVWNAATGKFDETTSRVIMASSLGNPMNFWTFDGVDTDSYQVAVASKGDFTGLCNYSTSLIAMKENQMFKVFGDYPSNYQMYDYDVPGAAKGCARSMAILGEVLYFVGPGGVYAYSGTVPERISQPLGERSLLSAAAGSDGLRYYLSAKDKNGSATYIYDTTHSLWMQEDAAAFQAFAQVDGKLYAADGARVWLLNPETSDEVVPWSVTLAPMDQDLFAAKDYRRIRILTQMEAATLRVEVCTGEVWRKVYEKSGSGHQTVVIPLVPNRGGRLLLRISGEGRVKLLQLVREFFVGEEG